MTNSAVSVVSSLGASAVAKKAVDATWRVGSKGKKPPTDPTDPDHSLREAIVFAILSGAVVSVVRTLIARRLARPERRVNRVQQAIDS